MNCLSLINKYICLPISQPLFTKPSDLCVKSKRARKVLSISVKALLSKSILFIISYTTVFFIPAMRVLTRISFESYRFCSFYLENKRIVTHIEEKLLKDKTNTLLFSYLEFHYWQHHLKSDVHSNFNLFSFTECGKFLGG